MKNRIGSSFLLIASSLFIHVPTSNAAPLVSIGDNADVFFNGSSSVLYSSNVLRDNDDELDDLWLSLTPGLELNIGRGLSNLDLSVITRYEIRRYADLDDLDTELFSVEFDGAYRSSRLDVTGSAYFRESKGSSGDVNILDDLIESDNMGGDINAEYRFSPKFSFGAGFRYAETEYKTYTDFLADRERFDIPTDIFYELTPKVDLSLGYTYSESEVESLPAIFPRPAQQAFTTEDHFFNVGARGNLLPKLTGFFKVGYRVRDDDRAGTDETSMLGMDADLTWATTPKLTNRLGLSRDFGVSGDGFSSENTSVSVTSNYSINSYFAASAFGEYTLREFIEQDIEDDQYRLGLRLNYTPNEFWQFSAGYTYTENDTDDDRRSFEDHTLDLTASLRY